VGEGVTETKVYKIRRKSDGFFSGGGMHPSFSKKGKVWSNLQALRSHITLVKKNNGLDVKYWSNLWGPPPEYPYKNCELIEYIGQENIIEEL
jgi:hypothetical protein